MSITIKAITIDAAGTLIQPWPSVGAVYGEVARNHGIEVQDEAINERFFEVFGRVQKNKQITIGEEKDFWKQVVCEVFKPYANNEDINPVFEILWDLFAEGKHWRIANHAKSTLNTLKDRGYRIAVLSNNDSRLRSVLNDHKIDTLFEHIFISSEIGFEKPDKKIFEAVENKMDLPAESFLHLGDSYSRDFEGAKSAGWKALLFGRPIIEKEQITSFTQLLDRLP